MKSLTGKFASGRGWALLLILFLGAGLVVAACGDEDVPAPTTPAPPPPTPPPAPEPEPEPEPEPPAVPVGLMVSATTESSITWTWNAVEGATGYVVQSNMDEMWDDTDTVVFNGVRFTAMTTYTRTELDPATTVYVRVAAAAGTVDAPLVSNFSTHVTGMTMASAPTLPPAPTNVRVTGQTDTTITWRWNAVEGAAGYQVQHSDSATIGDDAPTAFASTTTHTVSNLPSRADRHLRVRAYLGTISEPLFGDWSATVEGTTERPAAPVTTALSAPTGLGSDSETATTITLSWTGVDDADTYEVQQRPDDGNWGSATCGSGGDDTVTSEECVATGLTRGTGYSFRVRAHPDPDDDTLEQSGWSSSASAQTSGTPPSTPIAGGDDDLNITWESDDNSITWFWDPPSDTRITNLIARLGLDSGDRPSCPPIADLIDAFADGTDGWYDAKHQYAQELPVAAGAGEVRGLCVRRTWMDGQDNQQYGPVSVSWATTAPKPVSTAPDGQVPIGVKDNDAGTKTSAIDWYVELDKGFVYRARTISAVVGDPVPSCTADDSGTTTDLKVSGNDESERYRLTTPGTYSQYAACVQATGASGSSSSTWTQLTTYNTRPPAPSSLTTTLTSTTDDTSVNVTLKWSFSGMPEIPDDYDLKVFTADGEGADKPSLTGRTCATTDGFTPVSSDDITTTASGFVRTAAAIPLDRPAIGSPNESHRVVAYACVRAKLPSNGDAGPWRSSSLSRDLSVKARE